MYQKKPEPNYLLVQYPRKSRCDSNFGESTISPLPDDSATQGDIFNDSFLRQMTRSPVGSTASEPPERSTLEHKRPVTLNVYEDTLPPAEGAVNEAPTYDAVPSSRYASGSVTSQSSRDSVPAFPPPSSDEAIRTLRNFMNVDMIGKEGSNIDSRNAQALNDRPIYENYDFRNQNQSNETHDDFPRHDDGIYDNVVISNKPIEPLQDVGTDLHTTVSNSMSDESNEQIPESSRISGVKQHRTRDSVKESNATLNESYEWSKVTILLLFFLIISFSSIIIQW